MNLIKANIENLTSLWQLVGQKTNAFYTQEEMKYCEVINSEWPNRLWFPNKVSEANLEAAKQILLKSSVEMKISCWNDSEEDFDGLFEKCGFEKVSKQIGMVLKFNGNVEITSAIKLERVLDKTKAVLWSELFGEAFNYRIAPELLLLSWNDVEYFIAYDNEQPVGTCLLYSSASDVVGIHSLGIIPSMRRKGYAEKIMKLLLNESMESGFSYATLQASEMAKVMYAKLGFSTQFMMNNYRLKK
ncbi:GNAT family N-acetyltransferase [Maribellus comscasis]|uniref:GNAT family N-acetyltransferase n=1 Tax=Maribellus comscasis TaxID=2681766 RepID=A0A6I6JX52_9BACT|nr:GNAT family N-acetyltransferase [Maribellus comscasis]QGY45720.1 GNAT family N-acetyltransferase [Maribellus comscasis]